MSDKNQFIPLAVTRRDDYIASLGWRFVEPVAGDCSSRSYFRIRKGGKTAVLMDAGQADAEGVRDFIRISEWLRSHDIHAPEIIEYDVSAGFVIMEDFGSISFRKALELNSNPRPVYTMATNVLTHLSSLTVTIDLPDYYESNVHTGRRRIIDWYLPLASGRKNPDGLVEEFLQVWNQIEDSLPPCPQSFLHIDYHVENLMWLPEEEDTGCVGVLDFQGAMTGPKPYDLANLLEDVRVDISSDIRQAILVHYCSKVTPQERKILFPWYRVLATQFHCRVMGQFIKIAIENNNSRYLEYLPRIAGYLKQGLEDPLLQPLKEWFGAQGLDFSDVPDLNMDRHRELIRPDAF